jgi:lipopolysaccharide export LptBFGC system permease protein LptF
MQIHRLEAKFWRKFNQLRPQSRPRSQSRLKRSKNQLKHLKLKSCNKKNNLSRSNLQKKLTSKLNKNQLIMLKRKRQKYLY